MRRLTLHTLLIALTLLAVSCSTKKNTSMTRFWHGFTAKYNIYYNGAQAYIDASLEKENGNKDNYTERLPLYTVGNKASRDLGKSNYETAITKSKKAIQLHSIKARPEWNKDRRKTEKEIEWLSRKEYNPFLWKAWMLMGRSQFYQGKFDEAAATFSYMSRLYKGQPAIYGKARAWLAKCYVESDWLYDAEDVIRNMRRDSIDWRAQKEWDYTLCDYYLHRDELPKAKEYLIKVIRHEMRSKQKARELYLLGQIEAAMGNRQEAYKAFKRVIRQNPPYELEFNARISMTEVSAKGQAKKMIGKLRRMARNDNNKDYLDQVYYAIGNIYLAEKDTAHAVAAYETGNEKATRNGIEKGVLLLHLGDLYWQLEKYGDAKRCYGEAIGLLDKERPDYDMLSERSKILDELVPYTDAIELQDSLQALTKMDEKERNAAIDRVIDALKKKEKEEEAAKAEQELQERQQKYGSNLQNKANGTNPKPTTNQQRNGAWYFYNPQLVQQGKQTFLQKWGKRENTDNWQRYNKTVVGDFATEEVDTTMLSPEQRDSIAAAEEKQRIEEEKMDSAVNDPHKREYYMAQLPFSEEAMAASNDIIKDGLYHSAVIFKDKLDNLPLSEKAFKRLMNDYPEYDPKDEMYYHLFLLYSRMNQPAEASAYVRKLQAEYPDSKWTTILSDPYFEENARFGTALEDSLYGATYAAFKEDRFKEVYDNAKVSEKRFPLGANRDRFIFISGLTHLNDGNAEECLKAMQTVVKDYPESKVAEMAGMIINGVKEGKRLHGAKFDLSDVWNRRNATMDGTDSIADRALSPERNTDFLFIMAYAPDSIDENKLLFQMARFNFTSFLVRNFDLTIEDVYGMHHLTVSGFRNFNEARQYARMLLQQEGIKRTAGHSRPIIISKENLELLGSKYSYNDYDAFYVKNFAPLPITNPEQLYEPVRLTEDVKREEEDIKPSLPTEEVAPGGVKPVTPAAKDSLNEEELLPIPAGTEIAMPDESTDISAPIDSVKAEENSVIDIPSATDTPTNNGTEIAVPNTDANAPATDMPADNGTEITVPNTDANVPTTNAPVDNGMEITIPAQDNEAKEEDTLTIPDTASIQNTPQDDGITLPAESDSNDNGQQEDTIVIEDGSNKRADNDSDEEIIVVDDNKKSTEELEDEYYELDGF